MVDITLGTNDLQTDVITTALGLGDRILAAPGSNNANRLTLTNTQSGTQIDLGANGTVPGSQGDSLTLTSNTNNVVEIANIETVTSGTGNDLVLVGGITATTRIDLGGGADTINITAAASTLTVTGVEVISGGAGSDVITFTQAVTIDGAGALDLNGGTDRINLANGLNRITVREVESVIGGTGSDTVTLATTQNTGFIDLGTQTLVGAGDVLNLANIDTISAANTITAAGVETINGGTAADFITLIGSATSNVVSDVRVNGGSGNDRVTTAGNFNRITLENVESVVGGGGADSVTFVNVLSGTANVNMGFGLDRVQLADGNNTAAIAAETILGGLTGNDVITGAALAFNWLVDLGDGTDRFDFFASTAGTNSARVRNVETVSVAGASATNDVVTFETATTTTTTVVLGAGNDRVVLASTLGNQLEVGVDIETVQGGNGADRVTVEGATTVGSYQLGLGNDALHLADGINIVTVSGVEAVVGGTGNDRVTYLGAGTGLQVVDLAGGDDTITLALALNNVEVSNVETVNGGGSADTVTMLTTFDDGLVDLNLGLDRLILANGGNTLRVEEVETLVGGSGFDDVTISGSVSGTMFVTGVESITGGGANDVIIMGTAVNNDVAIDLGGQTAQVGAGDRVNLFATADNTISLAGTESVVGGARKDQVTVDSSAQRVDLGSNLAGAANGDVLSVAIGSALDVVVLGVETVNGGAAIDSVTLGGASNTVTLSNVERVTGSIGTDLVTFATVITEATDIELGGGVDRIFLGGGNDVLRIDGDSGIEVAFGGGGNDRVIFAAGANTAVTLVNFEVIDGANADGNNVVTLGAVFDGSINLGAGSDRLFLAAPSTVAGAAQNDVSVTNVELVVGSAGADTITVVDAISGPVSGAAVRGGLGNDLLTGGSRRDQLTGGLGSDTMTGGDGSDIFRFALNDSPATPTTPEGRDFITDFEAGVDLLVFTGLLRGEFTWQGTAALTATGASQARWDGALTNALQIDADGNGTAEIEIVLSNGAGANLSQTDFFWL